MYLSVFANKVECVGAQEGVWFTAQTLSHLDGYRTPEARLRISVETHAPHPTPTLLLFSLDAPHTHTLHARAKWIGVCEGGWLRDNRCFTTANADYTWAARRARLATVTAPSPCVALFHARRREQGDESGSYCERWVRALILAQREIFPRQSMRFSACARTDSKFWFRSVFRWTERDVRVRLDFFGGKSPRQCASLGPTRGTQL